MLSEDQVRHRKVCIVNHGLCNEAFDALEDIVADRAALLQRIEAAELSEEIARKDSRKYEEFYHGVRDELRNENAALLARLERAERVVGAAALTVDQVDPQYVPDELRDAVDAYQEASDVES